MRSLGDFVIDNSVRACVYGIRTVHPGPFTKDRSPPDRSPTDRSTHGPYIPRNRSPPVSDVSPPLFFGFTCSAVDLKCQPNLIENALTAFVNSECRVRTCMCVCVCLHACVRVSMRVGGRASVYVCVRE